MEHPSRKFWEPEESAGYPTAFWLGVFPCWALPMVVVAFLTLLTSANNTRCDREPNNPIPGVNPKRRDRSSRVVGSVSPLENPRKTRQQQQSCISENILGSSRVVFR